MPIEEAGVGRCEHQFGVRAGRPLLDRRGVARGEVVGRSGRSAAWGHSASGSGDRRRAPHRRSCAHAAGRAGGRRARRRRRTGSASRSRLEYVARSRSGRLTDAQPEPWRGISSTGPSRRSRRPRRHRARGGRAPGHAPPWARNRGLGSTSTTSCARWLRPAARSVRRSVSAHSAMPRPPDAQTAWPATSASTARPARRGGRARPATIRSRCSSVVFVGRPPR